jgi:hypothetical protein
MTNKIDPPTDNKMWIISNLVDDPGRIQGFKGPSEMLKNYKERKVCPTLEAISVRLREC